MLRILCLFWEEFPGVKGWLRGVALVHAWHIVTIGDHWIAKFWSFWKLWIFISVTETVRVVNSVRVYHVFVRINDSIVSILWFLIERSRATELLIQSISTSSFSFLLLFFDHLLIEFPHDIPFNLQYLINEFRSIGVAQWMEKCLCYFAAQEEVY